MGDRSSRSRQCWRCGASLEWPRCVVCREISHLTHLLQELDRWVASGRIPGDLATSLREPYEQRLGELADPRHRIGRSPAASLAPRVTALVQRVVPAATATPDRQPTVAKPPAARAAEAAARGAAKLPNSLTEPVDLSAAWERMRSVAGLTWFYAVGVVFFVAGLAWLVTESSRQAWARWMLVLVVGALAGLALSHGRRLLASRELRLGGQAVLAIGVLLTPATVFSLRAAAGLDDPVLATLAWVLGTALAFSLALSERLPSQLLLGDALWAAAALCLARVAAGEAARRPAWCALFLAPGAALNGWLAWRARAVGEAGEAMLKAARHGALGLAAVASAGWLLAVMGSPAGEPDAVLVLAPLLLAGTLVGLAFETDRPPLIAWAAAALYLAGGLSDFSSEGLAGQTLGVVGLLIGAAVTRRDAFRLWFAGSATVAAALLLLPWVVVSPPRQRLGQAALSGWLVSGMYLALAVLCCQRWLLWTTTVAATATVMMTVRWAGGPVSAESVWLAVLALAPLYLGVLAGEREWAGRRLTVDLYRLPFIPLLVALLRSQAGVIGLASAGGGLASAGGGLASAGGGRGIWEPTVVAALVSLASAERYGLWLSWYGAALVLAPHLPDIVWGEGETYVVACAAALTAVYVLGAARHRTLSWLGSASSGVTVTVLFALAASPLPVSWYGAGLAALALGQLGLARAGADDQSPELATGLRWFVLLPLILGYAAGLVTGLAAGFDWTVVAGLLAVSAAAWLLARELGERRVMYLTAAGVVTAAALLAQPLPDWADAWLTVALTAAGLTAAGLLDRDYGGPLEVVGAAVQVVVMAASVVEGLIDNGWPVPVRLTVVALTFALPVARPFLARTHQPAEAVEAGWRHWLALVAAALAGGAATALAGSGAGLGVAAVGLLSVVLARLAREETWRRVLTDAAAPAAEIGSFLVCLHPDGWGLAALQIGQAALLLAAARRPFNLLLAGVLWLMVMGWWTVGWPLLDRPTAPVLELPWSLVGLLPAAGQVLLLKRQSAAGPALLLTLIPTVGLLAGELVPRHWEVSYLLLVALAAGLAVTLRPRSTGDSAACAWLGVAIAFCAALPAMVDERQFDAVLLLTACTAMTLLLERFRRAPVGLPVAMGNLTAVYALGALAEPRDAGAFAFLLALLGFLNTVLAAWLRPYVEWRKALLNAAAGLSVVAFWLLWPADQQTVFGLLAISAACFTAAYAANQGGLNDLGFIAAWFAWCLVLLDSVGKGHDDLAPYRSLDLYVVPIGGYLLATVERRGDQPGSVRWTWAISILGSLLISSLAAANPGHDAVLFLAVLGAVMYGVARPDPAVRWLGLGTFALYVILQAWRWRTGAGKAMLIAMLIAAGVGTIVAALRAERRAAE